jgi:glyoxylase-like metal-dependent hydrolase (beta-lactamase superfamily II)
MAVFSVNQDIYGIDLFEERRAGRSSAYLIRGSEPILVDPGSALSHQALEAGLGELGLRCQDLRHVIITHVHLDHAGGVGQLMQHAAEAVLHCHPRAKQHMVDPSRLEAGARAVYGDQTEQIFGKLLPVQADRVIIHEDGDHLETGDRTLVFYDSPGHAKHHTCVIDVKTRGIFSGDTIGIRYAREYTGWDFVYGFPTTTPSDFDPDVMLQTLDRLEALDLARVYHTHYGVSEAGEAFDFARRGTQAIRAMTEAMSPATPLAAIEEGLRELIRQDLAEAGRSITDVSPLALDIMLNSQGILVYLQKKALGKL